MTQHRRQNTLAHIAIKCDVFYKIERRSGYMRVTSVRLAQNGHTHTITVKCVANPRHRIFSSFHLACCCYCCSDGDVDVCLSLLFTNVRVFAIGSCESVYFYSRGKSLDGKLMCTRLAESRAAVNHVDNKRPVFVTRTLNRYKFENESC